MDESKVLNLVDELTMLLEEAKPVFGKGNLRQVNVDEALGILDEIRDAFPAEIEQARAIVYERQNLLDDAQAEANRLIEDAKLQVRTISSENEVVRVAYLQAQQVESEARDFDRETRMGAQDYAAGVFDYLERDIDTLLGNVRRCRERMNSNFNTNGNNNR